MTCLNSVSLKKKIGYTFKDKSYLRGAMTHSSYSGGKNNGSNERLEFLGDSVASDKQFRCTSTRI